MRSSWREEENKYVILIAQRGTERYGEFEGGCKEIERERERNSGKDANAPRR